MSSELIISPSETAAVVTYGPFRRPTGPSFLMQSFGHGLSIEPAGRTGRDGSLRPRRVSENRLDHLGLRQQVLRLWTGVSPVPEITFTGPVDDALPAEEGS
jgi:hypothetical protein